MSAEHPLDPNFVIDLPVFSGPLDLLLHLIQKHELEILDLPISFVTEKYLAYLDIMQQLDLDIASEYLLMAATLAHIKSKMLLPVVPAEQDENGAPEDEIDPREELIKRLLEYQKYKAAAEDLGTRGVAGRDVFVRGMDAPEAQGPAPLADVGLYKLLDAFQAVVNRSKLDFAREISSERINIQDRISQITEYLTTRKRVVFEDLFDGIATRYDLIVTFMAILEMAKMHLLRVSQDGVNSSIFVESALAQETSIADASKLNEDAPQEPTP